MDNATAKICLQTTEGQQEVDVSMETYKEANELGLSLGQLLNLKYPSNVAGHGTAMAQAMAQSGLFMQSSSVYGIRPPTIGQAMRGVVPHLSGSAIVRPEGSERYTPAGRVLFPAVLIDQIESELRDNKDSYNNVLMGLIAQTRSINSPRYDQVIVNLTGPRASESMPIAQLAEPVRMLSITTGYAQKSLPVFAIGMEFSDQALEAATLDLIGLALREQGMEERSRHLTRDIMAVINGSVDAGEAGVLTGAPTSKSFDAALTVDGTLSQKAWVKYLFSNWRRRTITHALMNIDSYFAVEGRSGRPTRDGEPASDERLNTVPRVTLPGIPQGVQIVLMDDFPVNTVVGIDASKAFRRIVYAGAAYKAVEEFVMRRATAIRVDWAERIESAGYTQAFAPLILDNTP